MTHDYTGVLLEDMNHKLDLILEAGSQMSETMKTLAKQEDLDEVKQDVKTIKAAVTDVSRQVHDHERRITKLEAA